MNAACRYGCSEPTRCNSPHPGCSHCREAREAIGQPALGPNPQPTAKPSREATLLAMANTCERYVTGRDSCIRSHKVVGARYADDAACWPCSIRAVLDGVEPDWRGMLEAHMEGHGSR